MPKHKRDSNYFRSYRRRLRVALDLLGERTELVALEQVWRKLVVLLVEKGRFAIIPMLHTGLSN